MAQAPMEGATSVCGYGGGGGDPEHFDAAAAACRSIGAFKSPALPTRSQAEGAKFSQQIMADFFFPHCVTKLYLANP